MRPEEAPLLKGEEKKSLTWTSSSLRCVVFSVLMVVAVGVCSWKMHALIKENGTLSRRAMALEVQVSDAEAKAAKDHAGMEEANEKEQREQKMAITAWEDEAKATAEKEKMETDTADAQKQAKDRVAKAEANLAAEQSKREKAEEEAALANDAARMAREKEKLAKETADNVAVVEGRARKKAEALLALARETTKLAQEKATLATNNAAKANADLEAARKEAATAKKKVDTVVAQLHNFQKSKEKEVKGLLVVETRLARKVAHLQGKDLSAKDDRNLGAALLAANAKEIGKKV